VVSEVGILDTLRALGGPEPQRGRVPAWWRGSRDMNVSIDAEQNVFYDHVLNSSRGVLTLIKTVLNCGRAAALAWLEGEGLIEPRTLTPEQRRDHARRRGAARSLALDIESWRCAVNARE
jgi:hypothetical protein